MVLQISESSDCKIVLRRQTLVVLFGELAAYQSELRLWCVVEEDPDFDGVRLLPRFIFCIPVDVRFLAIEQVVDLVAELAR